MASNPRTWPIFDGRVKPDAIHAHTELRGIRRNSSGDSCRFADFDVSHVVFLADHGEIEGDERWVGLPIFTTRKFSTRDPVRRDSGIDRPGDLKGRRVGVPNTSRPPRSGRGACSSTSSALHRGHAVLDGAHSFAQPPRRDRLLAPPGVTINQIPPEKNIGSMMLSENSMRRSITIANRKPRRQKHRRPVEPPGHQAALSRSAAGGVRYTQTAFSDQSRNGVRKEIVENTPGSF